MERININNEKALEIVVKALQNDGVVLLPTDTAYALCVDATNRNAVEKVFKIKERELQQALPAFISSIADLKKYVTVNSITERLVDNFWPGAVTLVLEAKIDSQMQTVNKDNIVGFRIPNNNFIQKIVRKFGKPITSTSANKSGEATCYSVEEVKDSLAKNFEMIDVIVDVGVLEPKPVSTIVKVVGDNIEIIRESAISREEINSVVGF